MATFDVQMDGARDYVLRLTVVEGTPSIEANTSPVSWSLSAHGTWGSFGNDATSWSVNIGGHVYSGTIPSFNPNPSQTIASGSTVIAHNADGTKTIAVSGFWNSNHSNIGKGTAGGSLALTTIPRIPYAFLRWDGDSEEHCTTAVRWDGTKEVALTTAVRWDGTKEVSLL